jgi:GTP cyclohydrolase I
MSVADNAQRRAVLEHLATQLLIWIGEDPTREGLKGTPARFARMWEEFVDYDSGNTETTFEAIKVDQMVIVSGMRVWSICEHHLLPFWCDVSIGYITRERVLGLSKFARIAHQVAHKLQTQERLAEEIAEYVTAHSGSADVAVLTRGEHLCMTMRGIKTEARMTTSVMRGAFQHEASARAEFLSLIGDVGR